VLSRYRKGDLITGLKNEETPPSTIKHYLTKPKG
jgi:hypothetical protein